MRRKDGQSNTSAKKLPPRNFRFSSGDFFIIGVIILFCAILIGGLFIHRKVHSGDARYVRITQDGDVLLEKNLSAFTEPTEFRITSERGEMVIVISSEKVYVKESSCADKICMHQGDLTSPGDGAVCLPNRVVVQIVSGSGSDGEVEVIAR
ncbi:MAG: NusG domain II-containing protein [Clostridiales bacterium]|jgi:hypothetical protein|nr:NusG domain II-containing protein [Clostridiales bacterium]MCR5275281.1 NusG domain II-containing protein [Clostridiales bacterium]